MEKSKETDVFRRSANVVLLLSWWMWSCPLKTSQTRSLTRRKFDLLAPFCIREFKPPTSLASVKSHSQEHFPSLSLSFWTEQPEAEKETTRMNKPELEEEYGYSAALRLKSIAISGMLWDSYTGGSYQTCIEKSKTQVAWHFYILHRRDRHETELKQFSKQQSSVCHPQWHLLYHNYVYHF